MGRPGRPSKEKLQKLYNTPVYLLRYTTWKCGRIERIIIEYLWVRRIRFGRSARAKVREIIQAVPSRHETLDALKRLQKRRIIKVEF